MNTLVLYDDEAARGFEPFALTRPVSELRAGTEIVRRRWEIALGAEATAFIGAPHLADFDELDAPPCTTGTIAAGTILVNARCAAALDRNGPRYDDPSARATRVTIKRGNRSAVSLRYDARVDFDARLKRGSSRSSTTRARSSTKGAPSSTFRT